MEIEGPTRAALKRRARLFRYDAHLEAAADLFDRDPLAWTRLPVALEDASGMYRDMRNDYRAAVKAGVIPPDDRGPRAA
ncbi:MAG: hypothetical protein M3Q27_09510 [Actinomycetota bacterium]|nr:hypothetical protein [Actinomycetota bacterium]